MGVISAISAPMPDTEGERQPMGLIEINLAGEIASTMHSRRLAFRRGVSSLPSLGDAIYLADKHDLTRIYAPPQVASIKIGSLFQDTAVPARLLMDELLAKHFIVVGSTGSGKSRAVTCILQRLLSEHGQCAHVMILDIHNEYSAAFGGLVEQINLDNFNLPFWMLDFAGMIVALASRDSALLTRKWKSSADAVVHAKRRYSECRHRPLGHAAPLRQRPRRHGDHGRHARAVPPVGCDRPGWTNSWAGWSAPVPLCPIAGSRRASRASPPTSATISCSAACRCRTR